MSEDKITKLCQDWTEDCLSEGRVHAGLRGLTDVQERDLHAIVHNTILGAVREALLWDLPDRFAALSPDEQEGVMERIPPRDRVALMQWCNECGESSCYCKATF